MGNRGSVNFGDRDITEWDTTEGNLYGIKIRELKLVQPQSWDISKGGLQ